MRKRWVVVLCVACLGVAGCATTPDSIKSLSTVEIQMWDAVNKDVELTVDTYTVELRHWTSMAFRQAFQSALAPITHADGTVDRVQYEQIANNVARQYATVLAKYDQNKADTLSAFDDKIRRAKYVQMLIDEYENSTGVSPETLEALTTELSGTVTSIQEIYAARKAREAAAAQGDDSSDFLGTLLDVFTGGQYQNVYAAVMGGLAPALIPVAPTDSP